MYNFTKFLSNLLMHVNCQLFRTLATCSADHSVKLWSTIDYRFSLDKVLSGHGRWVWDAAYSADSAYLVTASSDHTARLWDCSTAEAIRHYNGHQKAVVCIALHDISLNA